MHPVICDIVILGKGLVSYEAASCAAGVICFFVHYCRDPDFNAKCTYTFGKNFKTWIFKHKVSLKTFSREFDGFFWKKGWKNFCGCFILSRDSCIISWLFFRFWLIFTFFNSPDIILLMACSILVTERYVQRRNNSNFSHSETTVSVRHQSGWQYIGNVRVRVRLLGIFTKFLGRVRTQWSVSCSIVFPMASL